MRGMYQFASVQIPEAHCLWKDEQQTLLGVEVQVFTVQCVIEIVEQDAGGGSKSVQYVTKGGILAVEFCGTAWFTLVTPQ